MTVVIENLEELIPEEILDVLSPEATQMILSDIADAARAEWIRIAGAELFTTRRDYLAGIQPVEIKPGVAVISLVGQLPNLIEEGMDAFDLHDTLLGPNVPISEPGRYGKHLKVTPEGGLGFYRAIPFRHGTPGSRGAVGQVMGRQYQGHEAVKDAKKLGREVYKAAKELAATTSEPYGRTKYGGRLPAGMAPKLRAHHKTDIFAGMIREEKTYVRATQSQYTTFRTISTGSPGWLRPATAGKFYAQKVGEYVQRLAPQAFVAFVEGIG